MYLLDTNVVSEMRKAGRVHRRAPSIDRNVRAWVESVEDTALYLSVITILEIEIGVLLVERRDRTQGAILRAWLKDRLIPSFAERILSVDLSVAQRCAALQVPDPVEERDALIAATALAHGMTLVTRNVNHFTRTGVSILNPWER